MNEELKNKLTERFDELTKDEVMATLRTKVILNAFLAGGEYGYEYAVEKACEWMEDRYGDEIVKSIVEQFRKAMEE